MRYAALIEYQGTNFKGWQSQKSQRTVQSVVETALSEVANETISIVTAGRTDTGVHASGQVIHFDSNARRDEKAWLMGANTRLPDDARIYFVQRVDENFHARFSATSRSYRYIIYNRKQARALYRNLATHDYRSLDPQLASQAGQFLIGEHDFSAFRAAGCQARSPVRTISELALAWRDEWIWLDVRANAFLQHMVRNIAGVLLAVAAGERPVDWVEEVLRSRDRTCGGVTAPPHGLYLTQVDYPPVLGFSPDVLAPPRYWNS